jgi:hypothetical protein
VPTVDNALEARDAARFSRDSPLAARTGVMARVIVNRASRRSPPRLDPTRMVLRRLNVTEYRQDATA